MGMNKTIVLCMIVKDEAKVIERCFDSLIELVDEVIIMDTGSTDGTQAIIDHYFRSACEKGGIKATVLERPWVNFGYNRTEVLEYAFKESTCDYVLMIDADEVLEFSPDFNPQAFKNSLTDPLYYITSRLSSTEYFRSQLTSNNHKFSYKGVIHEFLVNGTGHIPVPVKGIINTPIQDGARSSQGDTVKYKRDALTLEEALKSEEDSFLRSRYTFYMAQCFKDAGMLEDSLDAYIKYIHIGTWNEEIFISMLNIARLMERLEFNTDTVLNAYKEAAAFNPNRLEAIHGHIKYLRILERYEEAWELGKGINDLITPQGLFIETWIYDYGLYDELSIVSFYTKQYIQSINYLDRLARCPTLPDTEKGRIKSNVDIIAKHINELVA